MFKLSLTITVSNTPRPRRPRPNGPSGTELAGLILNTVATIATVLALFIGG